MDNKNNIDDALKYYLQIIHTDGIDSYSKVNILIKISLIYKEEKEDLDNALKYAAIASTMTFSPRADICCLMGDIYEAMGNIKWAQLWYEQAISNMPSLNSGEVISSDFYTTTPMLKLCRLHYDKKEYIKAKEYNDAVLVIEPNNEDAIYNKGKLEETMQ